MAANRQLSGLSKNIAIIIGGYFDILLSSTPGFIWLFSESFAKLQVVTSRDNPGIRVMVDGLAGSVR